MARLDPLMARHLDPVILAPHPTEQWAIRPVDRPQDQDLKCLVDLLGSQDRLYLIHQIFRNCKIPSMLWKNGE